MRRIVEGSQDAGRRERSSVRVRKSPVFVLVFVVVLTLAGACAESSLAARGHEFAVDCRRQQPCLCRLRVGQDRGPPASSVRYR